MVKKVIKKAIKKGIKKIREPQSGAPEGLTARRAAQANRAAAKPKPKVSPKPKPKVSPTAGKPRGRPKGSKNKPKTAAAGVKSTLSKTFKENPALSTIAKGSAIAGLIGGGAGLGNFINKRNKPATKAAKVTFGEAFKKARKEGEGTKFTYNGKSYTAVTKDDLKKKGYDANELKQYANRKGKARGPVRRAAQGIKKILLGKDKKFGGDKGAIDFIRKPKKKAAPQKKMGGGMANASAPKKYKAGGMATKGLGKAYMKSKR
jgi:hypothetical protein